MDELLRGRGHSAGTVQHHPQPQIILVPHVLDQEADLQEDEVQTTGDLRGSGSKSVDRTSALFFWGLINIYIYKYIFLFFYIYIFISLIKLFIKNIVFGFLFFFTIISISTN